MCEPDYCIIVSPLDKPRCFWGKQFGICLNLKKKKKMKINSSPDVRMITFTRRSGNFERAVGVEIRFVS